MSVVIYTKTKEDLAMLYNDSALTWEGMDISDENLEAIQEWIIDNGAILRTGTFYVTKGNVMNDIYGLTGSNRYPEDLNIVSCKLSDMDDAMRLVMARFSVGGRWFDDVVDNNLARERSH